MMKIKMNLIFLLLAFLWYFRSRVSKYVYNCFHYYYLLCTIDVGLIPSKTIVTRDLIYSNGLYDSGVPLLEDPLTGVTYRVPSGMTYFAVAGKHCTTSSITGIIREGASFNRLSLTGGAVMGCIVTFTSSDHHTQYGTAFRYDDSLVLPEHVYNNLPENSYFRITHGVKSVLVMKSDVTLESVFSDPIDVVVVTIPNAYFVVLGVSKAPHRTFDNFNNISIKPIEPVTGKQLESVATKVNSEETPFLHLANYSSYAGHSGSPIVKLYNGVSYVVGIHLGYVTEISMNRFVDIRILDEGFRKKINSFSSPLSPNKIPLVPEGNFSSSSSNDTHSFNYSKAKEIFDRVYRDVRSENDRGIFVKTTKSEAWDIARDEVAKELSKDHPIGSWADDEDELDRIIRSRGYVRESTVSRQVKESLVQDFQQKRPTQAQTPSMERLEILSQRNIPSHQSAPTGDQAVLKVVLDPSLQSLPPHSPVRGIKRSKKKKSKSAIITTPQVVQ